MLDPAQALFPPRSELRVLHKPLGDNQWGMSGVSVGGEEIRRQQGQTRRQVVGARTRGKGVGPEPRARRAKGPRLPRGRLLAPGQATTCWVNSRRTPTRPQRRRRSGAVAPDLASDLPAGALGTRGARFAGGGDIAGVLIAGVVAVATLLRHQQRSGRTGVAVVGRVIEEPALGILHCRICDPSRRPPGTPGNRRAGRRKPLYQRQARRLRRKPVRAISPGAYLPPTRRPPATPNRSRPQTPSAGARGGFST